MSTVTLLLALSAALFVACGGADHPLSKGTESEPTKLNDYGFEAPDTIAGGTVEISFTNKGKEPHFAGLAVV